MNPVRVIGGFDNIRARGVRFLQEAARLGLWLFIANELMLFGGLFMALTVYRIIHTETTRAASEHLHLWIGGANTAVLLTSSLTMVLAVLAARAATFGPPSGCGWRRRRSARFFSPSRDGNTGSNMTKD